MKKFLFWLMGASAVLFVTACFLCGNLLAVPVVGVNTLKIVIDAGHGGIDSGVVGAKSGEKESDINLTIAFLVKEKCDELGFETVMTRKTKEGLYGVASKGFKRRDMAERKRIIEEENPSLVLSIHQNFYPSRVPRGAQVFFGKDSLGSDKLAGCLQQKLNEFYVKNGSKNRTQATGDYFMLQFSCPCIIVECGFLSNAEDEKLLTSSFGQENIAGCIVQGLLLYLQNVA